MPARVRAFAPMIGSAIGARDQPEEEAQRSTICWNSSFAAEVAAEHRARAPRARRRRAPRRSAIRPFAVGSSGCGWLTSQKPSRAGQQEPGEARPRPLAEDERRRRRRRRAAATFWSTTGVMKSLWKSASVKRIVAIADAPAPIGDARRRRSAAPRCTARAAQASEQRQRQGDEHDVLAEDDRRRGSSSARAACG